MLSLSPVQNRSPPLEQLEVECFTQGHPYSCCRETENMISLKVRVLLNTVIRRPTADSQSDIMVSCDAQGGSNKKVSGVQHGGWMDDDIALFLSFIQSSEVHLKSSCSQR